MANKKESALHKKLARELEALIPELDEEGLSFLLEQGRVHRYNMEADRLNREIEKLDTGRTAAAKGKKAGKKAEDKGLLRIERSPSGATYHVIRGGKWKMFNDGEMLSMVKIARSKDPLAEVAGRLYTWIERERPDAFVDLDIGDEGDPVYRELVTLMRKTFKVRDQ